MPRIHYFNPGHETAVLLRSPNYTAPAHVRKMQKDLSGLPLWYAGEGDYVYVSEDIFNAFSSALPQGICPRASLLTKEMLKKGIAGLPTLEVTPWGISPHSLHVFELLQEQTMIPLSIPSWKTDYFRLTGRKTAAECLGRIRSLLRDLSVPAVPHFCMSLEEVERYITLGHAPFILKTPYSSSGRGLLWLDRQGLDAKARNWVKGALSKQGSVSIERRLDKVQDFALEFYSDGRGDVRYLGLSVFRTEGRGAYVGNILEEQERMATRITRLVGAEVFLRVRDAVRLILQMVYGSIYKGCLGVDMLVFRQEDGSYAIHPCVEINMRHTMGMVALRIYQEYIRSGSMGEFRINYEKEAGEVYAKHRLLQEAYPLRMEGGRIREGFLSLCPVTEETHYQAYIIIKERQKE